MLSTARGMLSKAQSILQKVNILASQADNVAEPVLPSVCEGENSVEASHRAAAVHLVLEVSMAFLQLQVFTQQALVVGALLQQLLLQLPVGL